MLPGTMSHRFITVVGNIAALLLVLRTIAGTAFGVWLPMALPYCALQVGMLMAPSGLLLICWCYRIRSGSWGGMEQPPGEIQNHFLCTSGPYRYVRHPFYLGLLVTFLGVELCMPSYVGLLDFPVIVIFMLSRAWNEEWMLEREYPQHYPEYKKKTWRLVPLVY